MLCLESGPLSVSLTHPLTLSVDHHPGRTCECVHLLLAVVSPLLSQIYIYVTEPSLDMRKGGSSHLSARYMYIFKLILYRAEK